MPVTSVVAKDSLSGYLFDRMQERVNEVRKKERRVFSQNEFAAEIGVNPQTFSRYIRGETSMTLDQAVILLKYFGKPLVDHFEYTDRSAMDRDTAIIIAELPRASKQKRQALIELITSDEEPEQQLISGTQPT